MRLLDRTRLAPPLFALYERLSALAPGGPGVDFDQPLPPAHLRFKVAGTARVFNYVDGGRKAAQSVASIVERHGRPLSQMSAVLEFGCGCGRVLCHMPRLEHLAGSDINAGLIAWVQSHLDGIDARVNGASPPLAFDSEMFDLVFALSVFTHLPGDSAREWATELGRVLRPGGLLVFSTHGEHYLPQLTPEEQRLFKQGEPVERFASSPGSNLCNVYHPPAYVRTSMGGGFDHLRSIPRGALGNPQQDLHLFRKGL